MPRIKFIQPFKVIDIKDGNVVVETPSGVYLFKDYNRAKIDDIGMVGKYEFGVDMFVNFLSFEKDIKFCPVCNGIGYFPGKVKNYKCQYCNCQITISSDRYYEYFLSR